MEPENKVSLYGKIRLAFIFLPPEVQKNASKKKKIGPRTWEAVSKNLAFSTWDLKQLPKHTILTEDAGSKKKKMRIPSSIEKSLSFRKKKYYSGIHARAFAVPMETVCSADGLHT